MNIIKIIIKIIMSIFGRKQPTPEPTPAPVPEPQPPEPVKRMKMHEDVFNMVFAGEAPEIKSQVRAIMAEKDYIGKYPYYIETPLGTYTISRGTDAQGTQGLFNPKHK